MKKQILATFIVVVILLQIVSISALTASQARDNWKDARLASQQAQGDHRDAKLDYAEDKSVSNEQAVINTGKTAMHAALDEVEAWLIWKKLEAQENPEVPDDIQDQIEQDVEANIDKIDDLRTEVDGIQTRLEMGVVFLTMVGKYFELSADVARNSGSMWVHIANLKADKIAEYEEKLRDIAQDIDNNEDIIAKLDTAKAELTTARENINSADITYQQITYPGTPVLKFHEANSYLKAAKTNLIVSAKNLRESYQMILTQQ